MISMTVTNLDEGNLEQPDSLPNEIMIEETWMIRDGRSQEQTARHLAGRFRRQRMLMLSGRQSLATTRLLSAGNQGLT